MGIIVWILVGVVGGLLSSHLSGRKTSSDYALNIAAGIVGAVAVSYTHLDVYKRQVCA